MAEQTRRIVTGKDPMGTAIILSDGIATTMQTREGSSTTSTLLWVTDATPAALTGDTDPADRQIGIPPPDGGTVFRIVEFGPDQDAGHIDSPFDISDVWPSSYSSNTNEIMWGAKFAARMPWVVCVIRLSSYECGMDQPTYSPVQQIVERSGTLFSSRSRNSIRPSRRGRSKSGWKPSHTICRSVRRRLSKRKRR